jgi:N,N'-diacetyllegionaminate synthase
VISRPHVAALSSGEDMSKTFIIAEAGVNHNGSLEIAKKLIVAAKESGADAVKFQTFKTEKLVTQKARKADYQKKTTAAQESQFDMIKRLELSEKDHLELISECRRAGIEFLSSPFDLESFDLLHRVGVKRFKIPSGEITNLAYLEEIARRNRPIILSTGMSTLAEVAEALDAIFSTGNRQVCLLHCVTEYPAPFEEINLRAMQTMHIAFKLPVGYSDHTPGIEIPMAAVALGAEVIEKHFTLDRKMEGPDHKASLEPDELAEMIRGIRNIEQALGDGVKKPTACEIKNIPIARKSIVAARSIRKGQQLSYENIAVKRPGDGIPPKFAGLIVGMKASADIEADEVIRWEDLK